MKKVFIFSLVLIIVLLGGCMAPGAAPTKDPGGAAETVAASSPAETRETTAAQSTPAAAVAAAVIEPEQLISLAEAEVLTGGKLKQGEKRDTPAVGMKICFYDSQEDEGCYLQISLTQEAFMKNVYQTPRQIYDALKENDANPTALPGVGDEAFYGIPGLHLMAGDYYIVIAVGNSAEGESREILKNAGLLAVDNLKKALGR